MATLTLTDEEKEAESFLDWDDEALGKMVRATAHKIKSGELGSDAEPVMVTAALLVITLQAKQLNADSYRLEMEDVTHDGEEETYHLGDWEITAKKINASD